MNSTRGCGACGKRCTICLAGQSAEVKQASSAKTDNNADNIMERPCHRLHHRCHGKKRQEGKRKDNPYTVPGFATDGHVSQSTSAMCF